MARKWVYSLYTIIYLVDDLNVYVIIFKQKIIIIIIFILLFNPIAAKSNPKCKSVYFV